MASPAFASSYFYSEIPEPFLTCKLILLSARSFVSACSFFARKTLSTTPFSLPSSLFSSVVIVLAVSFYPTMNVKLLLTFFMSSSSSDSGIFLRLPLRATSLRRLLMSVRSRKEKSKGLDEIR